MRIGVSQSNYIPWRGLFDLIASVDVFVVYDDVRYSKNTWRNRNQVKTAAGVRWLTVPVHASTRQAIDEVRIARLDGDWRESHRKLLAEALEPAPHFRDAAELWEAGVAPRDERLSPMNVRLLQGVCEYLGIRTPFVLSRDYGLSGAKTERLLMLLRRLNATTYLSGPTAKDYLDEEAFRQAGIRLEYKTYEYAPYPQLWGAFNGRVSVLDLIANTGASARGHLRSLAPDEVAVG